MKTKVLEYSSADPNKIVECNRDLERINDDTYTYLYKKCEEDENQDRLGVVLKIEHVYFEADVCSRQFFQGRDVGKIGSEYVANFRARIEEDMLSNRHVNLLNVRIFDELGWDSKPLIEYREQWLERKKAKEAQKKEERALANEQAEREAAENEHLRLERAKADFFTGKNIEACDFIGLCQQAGVSIPLRTHGTLNARINRVNIDGSVYYIPIRGKRKPDTTGCHKLIQTYAETVKEENKVA